MISYGALRAFQSLEEEHEKAKRQRNEEIALNREISLLDSKINKLREIRKQMDDKIKGKVLEKKSNVDILAVSSYLLEAYCICGMTVTDVMENSLTIRYDTSSENQFNNSYTLLLEVKNGIFVVKRHNLPSVIPIPTLFDNCGNQEKLLAALKEIGKALSAFVTRTREVQLLKDFCNSKSELDGLLVVKSSESAQSISLFLTLDVNSVSFTVNVVLEYELEDRLPKNIIFDFSEDATESHKKNISRKCVRYLKTLKLVDAFRTIFKIT